MPKKHKPMRALGSSCLALFGLFTAVPTPADDAVYDVKWVNADPPQIVVMIDTNPWSKDTVSPTAELSVQFRTDGGASAERRYSFLQGATHPTFLEQGHVYRRIFPVDVAGAVAIQNTGLTFPSVDAKADSASSGARRGKTAATTDEINSVIAHPPASVDMQWYDRTDMAGGDFANIAVNSLQECSDLCLNDHRCRAFTLVRGESGGGVCWLKNAKPPATDCANCISGIKHH